MLVTGDIKCLHCGFISGSWVGTKGSPLVVAGLKGQQAAPVADPSAIVRCQRCAGPVFLDDASPVISSYRLRRIRRLREQIAAIDARRVRAA